MVGKRNAIQTQRKRGKERIKMTKISAVENGKQQKNLMKQMNGYC